MPTFVGYNTIGQEKNFSLTDFDLVKRDLLNAFNIRQGELPGRPNVGCAIWSMVFDNLTPELEIAVQREVQRIAAADPRIVITKLLVYVQENGLLVEVAMVGIDGVTAETLAIFFDQQTRRATYV